MYEAAGWYAAWNVYAVHHHISAWATALNQSSSERAILAAINPGIASTATSVLTSLIKKYGINPHADESIVNVLGSPMVEPAYGNSRVRGEASTLTGVQWRGLLVQRLGVVLEKVNFSFDDWLPMVEGGAYSTRGLAGFGALAESLAGD